MKPALPRSHWTPGEDARLRALYPAAPMADVLAALPARTLDGVKKRGRKLGLSRPQFWTAAEEARLREMWPDRARRTIERALRRPWDSVKQHAAKLGLTATRDGARDPSRWAGYVSVTRAAEIAGVDRETFVRVLDRYQEHFKTIDPEARKALPSPALCARGELLDRHRYLVVDEVAARDAMAWWDSLESTQQAAERMGVPWRRLNRHARVILGVDLPKADRRPAAWWDELEARAQALWRERWLASVRRAAAARRPKAAGPGVVRALPAPEPRKAVA